MDKCSAMLADDILSLLVCVCVNIKFHLGVSDGSTAESTSHEVY